MKKNCCDQRNTGMLEILYHLHHFLSFSPVFSIMKDNKTLLVKDLDPYSTHIEYSTSCCLVFGGFYLLVGLVDKHSFGIWVLFVATTSIFEMSRGGLIQYALIKFLSESTEVEKPRIISASFVLSGILMAVCIVVNISLAGFLSRLWHYPELLPMFLIFNGVYILQGILSQFQWIEQSYFRFGGILVTTMIRQGGFFFYILVCFIFNLPVSLLSLIYAQAISTGLAALLSWFYVRNYLAISYHLHVEWIKKLFNYGKFVFGTYISGMLSATINQMMLGTMISPDAAGSYNVAIRVFNLTDLPTNALGTIVFPQSAKRFAEQGKDAGKYLYEKSVGTILAVLVPLVIFVFCFPSFVVRVVQPVSTITWILSPWFRW